MKGLPWTTSKSQTLTAYQPMLAGHTTGYPLRVCVCVYLPWLTRSKYRPHIYMDTSYDDNVCIPFCRPSVTWSGSCAYVTDLRHQRPETKRRPEHTLYVMQVHDASSYLPHLIVEFSPYVHPVHRLVIPNKFKRAR